MPLSGPPSADRADARSAVSSGGRQLRPVLAGAAGLLPGDRFTDLGTLEAARDALVSALAHAGPLTADALDDLLSLTTDRTADSDTQVWLRLPMLRLAESGRTDEAFAFYARIGELTADRGAGYQNKLANKLHGALLTVCENAVPAERSRWIQMLPELPVQFAQILVRALVRVALDKVRDPLQGLAAENRLPGLVAHTIKNQLALHGRLSGSVVMDDLLARPAGPWAQAQPAPLTAR